jgi:cation/acetate symporter
VWKSSRATEAAELRVSRIAAALLGALVICLAVLFQHENIGFLATLPLVIAASVNFPMLILAMYWRGLTTRGAVAGGVTGLALSVGLLMLTPKVWVGVLGHSRGLFPYEYPTLFSLGAALLVAFLVSITDRSARAAQERRAFDAQFLLSERG